MMNKSSGILGAAIATMLSGGCRDYPDYTCSGVYVSRPLFAEGCVSAVRYRPSGSRRFISVEYRAYVGAPPRVQLLAENDKGQRVSCLSTDPSIMAAAQTITSDSWVAFTLDEKENCTSLTVSTGER